MLANIDQKALMFTGIYIDFLLIIVVITNGAKDENGTEIFRTDHFRFLYYDTVFEFRQT